MRFDEYVLTHKIGMSSVDHFDGFVVEVGLPREWEPLDSSLGVQVWFWRADPNIAQFGANAVLTLHIVEKRLDASDVFAMLCEQQVQMVPGGQELHREFATASEGPGLAGSLAMNIESQFGAIGSVALSRIIATEGRMFIVQLTATALRESRVDWDNIWLYVKPAVAAGTSSGRYRGGTPLSAPLGDSRGY